MAAPASAAIRLENLSKIYDLPSRREGRTRVVAADNLNLEIPAGDIFGLVGPNGAGKTTTLKMSCGLLAPTAGRITVCGVDVERDPEEAHGLIGYVADFFSLYDDLKVWEYLDYFAHAYKMPPEAIRSRIDELIHLLNLDTKRDSLISGLSRGMKQRVGIARAILHDPPVLVLDEPAVGLDPNGRVDLKRLITQLNGQGKTVFITSHLLADLEEICTSVAIIERGRLLRVGPLEQIVREAAGVRRIRLKVAAPHFQLVEWLSARPGISAVTHEPSGAQFSFAGGETELAALVKALVLADGHVFAVEEVAESLERVFSRLSRGEVM